MNLSGPVTEGVLSAISSREETFAKRGLNVTVYEKHRYAAMETSCANGEQLSTPSTTGRPVRIQGGELQIDAQVLPGFFGDSVQVGFPGAELAQGDILDVLGSGH